jgi:hypothetical protein
MVLVLVVEMGMDMALVREIEMRDDCHVQHEARTSHALLLKIHQGSSLPFTCTPFLILAEPFLPCKQLLKQRYYDSSIFNTLQTTLATRNPIHKTVNHALP